MAQQNSTTTLDGLFKTVYGNEGPINLVPEVSYLQKRIPFQTSERIGKSYNFPVVLTQEQGVSYLAAGSGVSTLESSVASQLKEAVVDAQQIIVRGQMDYEAAAKAQKSPAAFKNASQLLVENLMDTASKRMEIAMLYGRSPKGLGETSASTNINTTSTTLTFSAASWSPGIWSGLENANVNFYVSSSDALVSSAANAIFTVISVNFTDRKVSVSGSTTGITALDAAAAAPLYVHFKNARLAEPIGLDKIITNTGDLFGINATTYSMWAGSSFAVGGTITVAKIIEASKMAVAKGGLMEEADVLVSPASFVKLSGSMTDLRRQDGGDKKGIAGFETISLLGINGRLNVVPHPMVKEGEAFIVPMKRVKRIGSQEFSFETPGRSGELFLQVPDANAYELRLYGAQAIVAEKPAQLVKLTGITN